MHVACSWVFLKQGNGSPIYEKCKWSPQEEWGRAHTLSDVLLCVPATLEVWWFHTSKIISKTFEMILKILSTVLLSAESVRQQGVQPNRNSCPLEEKLENLCSLPGELLGALVPGDSAAVQRAQGHSTAWELFIPPEILSCQGPISFLLFLLCIN